MLKQLHIDADHSTHHPSTSAFFNNIEFLRFLFAWAVAAFHLNSVHYFHSETFVVAVVIMTLAIIGHHFVEKPAIQYFKRKWKEWESTNTSFNE